MCLALNPQNPTPPLQEFLTEWVAQQHDAGAASSPPTYEIPAVAPRSPRRRGPVTANTTKTMAAAAAAAEEEPQASAREPERMSTSTPQVATSSHDEPARRGHVGEGDDCVTPDPDPVRANMRVI